jgi:hypothetical protein
MIHGQPAYRGKPLIRIPLKTMEVDDTNDGRCPVIEVVIAEQANVGHEDSRVELARG